MTIGQNVRARDPFSVWVCRKNHKYGAAEAGTVSSAGVGVGVTSRVAEPDGGVGGAGVAAAAAAFGPVPEVAVAAISAEGAAGMFAKAKTKLLRLVSGQRNRSPKRSRSSSLAALKTGFARDSVRAAAVAVECRRRLAESQCFPVNLTNQN